MSYCRWSSDGWKSDVYTYAHVDGTWTTHVAGRKKVGLDTLPPDPLSSVGKMTNEEWAAAYKAYHDAYDALEFRDLNLPHDGETFKDEGPAECATRLRMLRDAGYHVPNGVIEELDEEAAAHSSTELSPAENKGSCQS